MSAEKAWHVSGDSAIARLTLDRPDKHNLLKMSEVDELIGEMQYVHAPGSDTYHAFRGCDRIRMIRPKPHFGKGDAAHECPDCAQLGVFSP